MFIVIIYKWMDFVTNRNKHRYAVLVMICGNIRIPFYTLVYKLECISGSQMRSVKRLLLWYLTHLSEFNTSKKVLHGKLAISCIGFGSTGFNLSYSRI